MKSDPDIWCKYNNHKVQIFVILMLLLLLIAQNILYAQIHKSREIRPTKFQEGIVIDGSLNDTPWRSATTIDSFYEINPGNMITPAVKTQVMLGYNKLNMYIGFICYEDTILNVKATEITNHKTDRILSGTNDLVKVYLKTRIDINESYILYVNPYRVKHSRYYKKEWVQVNDIKLKWSAAVSMTDSCWIVEIAIPFRSLRLSKTVPQRWQIDFWRIRPRKYLYEYSWSPHPDGEVSIYSFMGCMTINERLSGSRQFGFPCLW